MILYIATERNKDSLSWMQSQSDIRIELVIFDKRQDSLEQFLKTEIRKYASFSHVILDSAMFAADETDHIEEFIRSISYLSQALLAIVGDDLSPTEVAGVKWYDPDDVADRKALLKWILGEDFEHESEEVITSRPLETGSIDGDTIIFFKKTGNKLVCMGLDEFDQQPALMLAKSCADLGAQTNYVLMANTSQLLDAMADRLNFIATDDGYFAKNMNFYVNQADEDAHFIIFDMQEVKPEFVNRCGAEAVVLYVHGDEKVGDASNCLALIDQSIKRYICFIGLEDSQKRQIKKRFSTNVVFVDKMLPEECLEQGKELLPLNDYVIKGIRIQLSLD